MRLTEEQRRLVENNHNLIYHVLKQNGLSIDEYYDVAAIGLCKAAATFDDGKSKFSTYAYTVMLNEIRMSFRKVERRARLQMIVSLDSPIPGTEDATLADMIQSPDTPENYFSASKIQDIIRSMKPMQRRVIDLSMQGLTQLQIADAVGFSQPYVARLIGRAKRDIAKQI